MAIKPLGPHYSMENPPTIFDEEALTALELAARTAGKTNEAVAAFNELEKETGDHLTAQDAAIQKMNDETMPAKVTQEFKKNLDNGAFENMVDEYAGELTARVDNLTHTLTPGSTTGDAELIDTRLDVFGGIWPNSGGAIRSQVNRLYGQTAMITRPVYEEIKPVIVMGYYTSDGAYHENASGHAHYCTEIAVNPGEIYYISTHYGNAFPDAVGVRSDGSVKVYHESSTIVENNMALPCHIDGDMTHLRVNCVGDYTLRVYKLITYEPVVPFRAVSDLFSMVRFNAYLFNPISVNVEHSHFLENFSYNNIELVNPNAAYRTASINVKPGEIYHIQASCGTTGNHYYVIYTANGKPIVSETCYDTAYKLHKPVLMPENAATLAVSGYNVDPVISKIEGMTGAPNYSAVKWTCLGDSLTEANFRTTKNYIDYIREKTGIQADNHGVSGTGYMRGYDTNRAFYQRAANIPNDSYIVTIFGSGNDLGLSLGNPGDTGTDTVCGCINKTIDTIFQNNPDVILGVIAPTPWINNTPGDNGSMARYCDALETICRNRSIPYLDLFHESGLRPNDPAYRELAYSKDNGDGVHPDEWGHRMISGKILRFLDRLLF